MKLSQFIQTEMEQLLSDWEQAALEIAPEFRGEDSFALRHHARSVLEFICDDLGTAQTKEESARKALGKGKAPALALLDGENGRYRLKQGLTAKDIDELVRFNEAIDQLIANLVSSYSARKEQDTRLFETMLKVSPDPAGIFDPDGKYLFINPAMADLINVPQGNLIGKTPRELNLDLATELHNAITTTVSTAQTYRTELHHRLPSGGELYFDCEFVPVFNDRNTVEAVVEKARDITDRKQADYQVWRSANFDSLTGLPNRLLFLDRLKQTVLEAGRRDSSFALLFIDLDRFKQANDQLGHKGGDRVLAQVAERINTNVRAMDTVARLGGDEFTLILKDTDRNGMLKAAKAILTSLEQVFQVDSHQIYISASIGVTLFPDDGKNLDQLMQNADQAMYAAKEQGGQQVQVYEFSMSQSESDQVRLSRELTGALRESQLEVFYQPLIDIRTGMISRAEALLRWNHPYLGLLTPDSFLSISQENGMTDGIAAYVLEQAVISSLRWRDQNGEAFPININESPASFFTRSLVDQWLERLTQVGLDESRITMELTPESLKNIRASGFNPVKSLGLTGLRLHLAIDVFGIEPFSLLALQEFKLDSVKVDRDLIKEAGQGGDIDRILEAIIAMAHAIDIKVVGVGVETDEQLQFLTSAGCDYAQGFLFSKPLQQVDFEALLKRDRQEKPS